jgi:hypothetical protein
MRPTRNKPKFITNKKHETWSSKHRMSKCKLFDPKTVLSDGIYASSALLIATKKLRAYMAQYCNNVSVLRMRQAARKLPSRHNLRIAKYDHQGPRITYLHLFFM